jgi:hypothetical protein
MNFASFWRNDPTGEHEPERKHFRVFKQKGFEPRISRMHADQKKTPRSSLPSVPIPISILFFLVFLTRIFV